MQAMEVIYRKYYADVYRFAFMVTKHPDISEDIAQTVFLKIYKCANQYRVDGSVRAWIIQIARSVSYNVLKHNSLCQNVDIDDLISMPSSCNDFDGVDFLFSLDGLPSAMREIVVLHVAYRFTHEEVARMLSKSPSAVRQQYKRAIGLLKENYSETSLLKGAPYYEKI